MGRKDRSSTSSMLALHGVSGDVQRRLQIPLGQESAREVQAQDADPSSCCPRGWWLTLEAVGYVEA